MTNTEVYCSIEFNLRFVLDSKYGKTLLNSNSKHFDLSVRINRIVALLLWEDDLRVTVRANERPFRSSLFPSEIQDAEYEKGNLSPFELAFEFTAWTLENIHQTAFCFGHVHNFLHNDWFGGCVFEVRKLKSKCYSSNPRDYREYSRFERA